MRFKIRPEALERLDLPLDMKDVEFTGPGFEDGVLAGFTSGELYKIREVLDAKSSADIDPLDVRLCYYVLTVRRENPSWLPLKALKDGLFRKLADADFQVVAHGFVKDPELERSCIVCGRGFKNPVHDLPEEE